jgi:predicted dehydrogenase
MVNIGIVGVGFMGVTHIRAYRQIGEARIVAICDSGTIPSDGDLSKISGNIGAKDPVKLDLNIIRVYRDFRSLLTDPDVDLVDLCVPTPVHAEFATAALRSGKHVLCEKPLARTSTQAREIVRAAAKAPVHFMPAMCMRFWPQWLWVKRAIDGGVYGSVLAARFRRVCEPPGWNSAIYLDGGMTGGALLDLHIHDADFVQYCFGRPKAVYSRGRNVFGSAIDYVVTQYEVPGGATVSAEGGWVMTDGFGFNMAYTVNFENATVDYDLARGPDALRLFEKGVTPRTVTCEAGDGYLGELRHMIESILQGTPPTMVTAEDGLGAVEICEAEAESIQKGRVVLL